MITEEIPAGGLPVSYSAPLIVWEDDNITTSELGGLGFHERIVLVFILSIGTILTLFGNLTICLAVYNVRKLRRVHNAFYVNLALADIFIAAVMIFGTVNLITETQKDAAPMPAIDTVVDEDHKRKLCLLWLSLDLMSSFTVILSIAVLTANIHVHVIYPFKYEQFMSKRWPVALTVISIWCVSALVAFLPIQLGWQTRASQDVTTGYATEIGSCRRQCNPLYAISIAALSFYIPGFLICALNFRLYHHSQYHYTNIKKTSSMCSSINAFSVNHTGAPIPIAAHCGARSFVGESFNMGSLSCVNHHSVALQNNSNVGTPNSKRLPGNLNRWFSRSQNLVAMHTVVMSSQRMIAQLPLSRLKAVRTLGCMTISFLLCWGGFYTVLVINCFSNDGISDRTLLIISVIAYYNSCLNPLVYTRFNHDFQKGISSLFCKHGSGDRCSYDESTEIRRRRGSVPCVAHYGITTTKASIDELPSTEGRLRRVYSCSALI